MQRHRDMLKATAGSPSVRAVLGLGATQVIGWGTAFTPLMLFGSTFARDFQVPREIAFAGITVMLIVSALVAPRVGAVVGRQGARHIMMLGSLISALAMLSMARAGNVITYMGAWLLIGIAMPMALNNTAMPGLVEVVGRSARRAITALTLLSGLTSTVFLPIIAALDARLGWRGAYLVFAAMHVLICLPIHALVLARDPPSAKPAPAGTASTFVDGTLPASRRRLAFYMIAIWSCTEGMLTWGLNMQIIDVLTGLGMTSAAAIGVWMFTGISQASSRLVDLVLGGRFPILSAALTSAALAPTGFAFLLLFGVQFWSAAAYCILFGIAHGFFAIARNTLPLVLFGQREYAFYLGRLSLPQNVVNAAAPVVFAGLLSQMGPKAAIWTAAVSALLGLVAVIILVRGCRETPQTGGGTSSGSA